MKPKKPKSKFEWLDRRIAHPGPFLTLCLSEEEFHQVMAHMEIKQYGDWLSPQADATTHHLISSNNARACVVCMQRNEGRNPIEVAGLLVHEAVHVWQDYCERIGEKSPGVEQEAYAIQAIAQELMAEYARRLDTRI